MLRRLVLIGLTTALVGAVAGWVSTASAANDITGPETITVVAKTTKEVGADLGKHGFGPVDQFVFRDTLWDETGATKVGSDHGHCTLGFHGWTICEVALFISGRGEITSVGAFNQKADTADFPILGGTGEFDNVRGSAHVEFVSDTENHITLNLLP